MKKQRKHYTAEEKVAILRRHLLGQEPVSKLCDELELQPTVFYRWQKEFFENGAAAFDKKTRTRPPGRRNSSRMGLLPSTRKRGPGRRRNGNASSTWRRRSRPTTRSWLS